MAVTAIWDKIELADGGDCANNPALYGIADAVAATKAKNGRTNVC
ncbi:hypothetical protein [Falsirhodobacter sp. 1013]